jgi:hypothetical protein
MAGIGGIAMSRYVRNVSSQTGATLTESTVPFEAAALSAGIEGEYAIARQLSIIVDVTLHVPLVYRFDDGSTVMPSVGAKWRF